MAYGGGEDYGMAMGFGGGGGGVPPGGMMIQDPSPLLDPRGPPMDYGGGGGGGGGRSNGQYGGGGGGGGEFQMSAENELAVGQLRQELDVIGQSDSFQHAGRLLVNEIERLENNCDPEYLEVDIPKSIKLSKKILIPVNRHPHFNFVGKLLGPGGKTLQGVAKQFKCHVYILGRGSTKDRAKEEEQLNSGDPQFAHFGMPLHVKVETIAPPPVAYQRVGGVIEMMSRFLQPVRDEIVANQMESMGQQLYEDSGPRGGGRGGYRGRGGGGMRGGRGRGGGGGMMGQEGGDGYAPYPGYTGGGGGGYGGRGGGGTPGYQSYGGDSGGGKFPRGRGGAPRRSNPY